MSARPSLSRDRDDHRGGPGRGAAVSGSDQGDPRWCRAANVRTVAAVDLAPPPTDASPPPRRRPTGPTAAAHRRRGRRVLAERLDVDALWVRIAFVLLALVGGVGLLVYGAMWLAFIVGADPTALGPRRRRRRLVLGLPLLLSGGSTSSTAPGASWSCSSAWRSRCGSPVGRADRWRRAGPAPATPSGRRPTARPAADRPAGAAPARLPARRRARRARRRSSAA